MAEKKAARKRPSKGAKGSKAKTSTIQPKRSETRGSESSASISKQVEDPRWTVSLWNGMNNYECRFCAFATIDLEDAVKHFVFEHTHQTEERIIDTGLVNEDGTKITRVEVPAKED